MFLLKELAGSLGDLGTFVPIAVGMVKIVGFDAATLLTLSGLLTMVSGVLFRIPMAVQPMKAICALAIAGSLTQGETLCAGWAVGLCLVLFSGFGLIRKLDPIFPRPVICALQLAVAWQLLAGGCKLNIGIRVMTAPFFWHALFIFAVMLGGYVVLHKRLEWLALGFVVCGLVMAAYTKPSLLAPVSLSLWQPRLAIPVSSAWAGAWVGGIPQLPLTLLNSVFAVSALAGQLFPENRDRTTPGKIAFSVGLMNLIACPLGGMPCCHGSGGLASQHRMGATTGVSMIMLGAVKLLLGLCFGTLALAWMTAFPTAILGAFLMLAGFSLAEASGFWRTPFSLAVAPVMITTQYLTGSLAVGFGAGWLVDWLIKKRDKGNEP
ncbi:MAG: putative sulfate/molybdate transporter [bacterium]